MTPTPPRLSTAPLADLVTNTLDAGYAEAARRRSAAGTSASRRWYDRPATALGCALVGFIVTVGYLHTHRAAPTVSTVHAGLVARVTAAQAARRDLTETADRLTAEIAQLRAGPLAGTSGLRADLAHAQLASGALRAVGPGLSVRLADAPEPSASGAPGRPGTTPLGGTGVLTDKDVRSVVNQLWAAGAEAITVNDVRLTATSAIRFAGQAVLVDFQPVTSPYTIRAIGAADLLDTRFADSAVAGRYATIAAARGIGFSFATSRRLVLPATVAPALQYAKADR